METRFAIEAKAPTKDPTSTKEELAADGSVQEQQEAELARRERLKRHFAGKEQQREAVTSTASETMTATTASETTWQPVTKSFQERLLAERFAMESRGRLASTSLKEPTVPAPTVNRYSWSERSARNLLEARLAMMSAGRTVETTESTPDSASSSGQGNGPSLSSTEPKGLVEARLPGTKAASKEEDLMLTIQIIRDFHGLEESSADDATGSVAF